MCASPPRIPTLAPFVRAVRLVVGRLWQLTVGGPMRFASFDQKPAWFNSVAECGTYAPKGAKRVVTKEKHSDSRSRYSIMTSVLSWHLAGPGPPPRLAVLFKGKTTRILDKVESPPWMLLQHCESGSYRTEHITEFLEFVLPKAETHGESVVVLLDWYAPHLSEQVPAVSHSRCRHAAGSQHLEHDT